MQSWHANMTCLGRPCHDLSILHAHLTRVEPMLLPSPVLKTPASQFLGSWKRAGKELQPAGKPGVVRLKARSCYSSCEMRFRQKFWHCPCRQEWS